MFADRFWPLEENDIIKYETGSSIRPPLLPSWNCILLLLLRSGWPDFGNLIAWCGIACRLLSYGRSSNRQNNSNMTDVCFSKPEIKVILQLRIELQLVQCKMYKSVTNVPKLTTNDAYINPRTLLYLFHFGTLDVFYTSWHTRPVGRISGFLVH